MGAGNEIMRTPTDDRYDTDMLAAAVDKSPVVHFVIELAPNPRFSFISANVLRLTGHDTAAFSGDPEFAAARVHPADISNYRSAIEDLRTGGTRKRDYRLATASGEHRWFRDILTSDGDHVFGVMRDITSERQATARDQEAIALRLAISDCAVNAVIVVGERGEIIDFNKVAERFFAHPRQRILGTPVARIIGADQESPAAQMIARRLQAPDNTGEPHGIAEITATRADGSVFPAEINVTGANVNGRRVYIAELWDTTERRRVQAERERLSRLLDDAVQSSTTGIAIYDDQHILTLCNTAYAGFFGETPESLVGSLAADNHHRALTSLRSYNGRMPEVSDPAREKSMARLLSRANGAIEMQHKDGRWFQIVTRPTAEGGRVFVRTDITRLKQREAELAEARQSLEDAVESISGGFALYDSEDRLVTWNQGYRDHNAICADVLKRGTSWHDIVRTGAQRGQYLSAVGRIDEWLAEVSEQRDNLETEVELQQDDGRWYRFSYGRTPSGGTVVIRSDITRHQELVQALQDSEQRFRKLLEAYPLPAGMTRATTGEILYESPAARDLFQREDTPGTPATSIERFVNPTDRQAYLAKLRRDGSVTSYEVELKKADGTTLWVSITARLTEYEGDEVIVSSVYDMTERKAMEAELARQREALYQSEKLAALGSLLAGVAHELNNPLSVVVGQALLLQETATDPKVTNRAEKIGAAADRCSRIVRTFLAMARQQPTKPAAVDINDLVEATLEVTGYALRSAGIDVALDLGDEVPDVYADADQLNQVVINLIVNAQQAMADGAEPRELRISSHCDGDRVVLTVADTGPGMSQEIQSRIFEPFFTTKKAGAGTGIGLAVCHKIIDGLNGKISVESAPRDGAAFSISLPSATGELKPAPVARTTESSVRSSKILVIDDEPEVIRMLREILRAAGHDVTMADSGDAALRYLARNEYDVILCDIRMPGTDGPQLFDILKAVGPGLVTKVAFVTGDTFSPSARSFLERSGRPYVQKPFTPAEIQSLVATVLVGERLNGNGS